MGRKVPLAGEDPDAQAGGPAGLGRRCLEAGHLSGLRPIVI
jgi:hypothetical protein